MQAGQVPPGVFNYKVGAGAASKAPLSQHSQENQASSCKSLPLLLILFFSQISGCLRGRGLSPLHPTLQLGRFEVLFSGLRSTLSSAHSEYLSALKPSFSWAWKCLIFSRTLPKSSSTLQHFATAGSAFVLQHCLIIYSLSEPFWKANAVTAHTSCLFQFVL